MLQRFSGIKDTEGISREARGAKKRARRWRSATVQRLVPGAACVNSGRPGRPGLGQPRRRRNHIFHTTPFPLCSQSLHLGLPSPHSPSQGRGPLAADARQAKPGVPEIWLGKIKDTRRCCPLPCSSTRPGSDSLYLPPAGSSRVHTAAAPPRRRPAPGLGQAGCCAQLAANGPGPAAPTATRKTDDHRKLHLVS